MSNPYQDDTGTNRNLLGITDRHELQKTEYDLTAFRARQLAENPVQGAYDLDHLKAIHRHLFQDVYGWAGKERTLNFSKAVESQPGWKAVFARTDEIASVVGEVAKGLAERGNLKGLDKPAFVEALTDVYVRLNFAHPFPEGNGRTTRVLLNQIAAVAGHKLDFERVPKEEWNRAAALSVGLTHRIEPGMKQPASLRLVKQVFDKITDPHLDVTKSPDTASGREPGR